MSAQKRNDSAQGFDSPAFVQSRPILLVALVNKLGSIALSVIPILLVERSFSSDTSSWVMSSIRSALLIGMFASGLILDRLGGRLGMLLAFLLIGIGFGFLPFFEQAIFIALFGIIAQFGEAMSRISIRLLITESVGRNYQKEALGWMRTVNNLGQILSFTVGAAAAAFGVLPLFMLDAVTAITAAIVGGKILPKPIRHDRPSSFTEKITVSKRRIFAFFGCALILFMWTFLYELFMAGVAGRLERLTPGQGLRSFSILMVGNTILVTALAVKATGWFERPSRIFPLGLLMSFGGFAVAIVGLPNPLWLFIGILVVTIGELQLGVIGQFLLIRLLPTQRASGALYSTGMVISQFGKIAAAAVVFPWFIHQDNLESPLIWVSICVVVFTSLVLVFGKDFDHAILDEAA